ncbi:MAG: hypothetical protein H3C47_09340 [Candidatus Cloacimonetes bacterium]|nr:hypothetical protein [Candidatus Cloacimonadota bacterium]
MGTLALRPGVVELDASLSNLNGLTTREVSYFWRMASVPNPSGVTSPFSPPIQNASQVRAWFSARTPGIYVVELILVTDKQASTKPIQKRIEILNLAPKVELENSLVGLVNQPVLLDGRRSTDPNGDTLSWRWVQSSGPSILLQKQSNPALGLTSEFQSVSELTVDRVGRYVFELIATDPGGLNSRQQTSILISSQTEVFPLASAGADVVVRAGEYFNLRGDASRAKTAGASLIYLWEPISDSSSSLLPQKCRNQTYTVFSQNEESAVELVKAKPRIRIPSAGLYGFSLRVSELGRGLESNPDCVQVQVLPVNRNISLPNPQVFSQPIRVQASSSNVNFSLVKVLESGGGVYKTPVNHNVTMDASESYIAPLAPLISISESAEATIRSTFNCLHGSGPYPYLWKQTMGEAVVLKPLQSNCSKVSFAPVNVGVYVFELVLHSRVDGVVYPSLPRSMIVVVNDNFNEIPTSTPTSGINAVENNFIPYIVAPQASVGVAGRYTINPTCVDEDLQSIGNKTAFGEWNYSQADLRSCSSLGLSCRFTQMEGPPVQISGSSCSPEVLFTTGSYRFLIQAFDGIHYSLPVDWYVSVPAPNQAVPQADAGVSRTVTLGTQATLNGSLSISTVRDFEYLWRQRDGFPVILNQSDTVSPSFEPLQTGQYVFDLRISEPNGLISLPSEVTVIVQPSLSTVGESSTGNTQVLAQKALEEGGGGGGGGCFVVTAASGSSHSWVVVSLSQFRDRVLMKTVSGQNLVQIYYEYSPYLAEMVAQSPVFRILMLVFLIPLAAFWAFGLKFLLLLTLFLTIRLVIRK